MIVWIVYIDLDQTYHKQSLLQFMAVIHLTGSITLLLFGGALVFLGVNGIHSQLNCDHCNMENPVSLVMLLIGISMVSGGVAVAKAASKPAQERLEEKLEEQDERGFDWMSDDTHGSLKEYEDEYLARQGIKSTSRKPTARRKPAETRESESNFCDNCGKSLRPTAKFCSGCGSPRS